ncbi:hypothetical protein DFP72DRAFT_1091234 [Ephemerocybe angulata]|uniref:Uncharacterized protein n=1 Tax=Ephemerocybe angulata TaxID=980116 RepID=A0A8H6HGT6_9AGAR|nr:hypothetical protein DFP72DRAFT_1091234 [Tulosesus angulatus]
MSNNTDAYTHTRTDNDEPEPGMPDIIDMSWLNNPGVTVSGTITVLNTGPGSIVIDRGRGRTEIVNNGARVQAWTATGSGGTGPRTFTRMDGNELERRFPFADSHTSAMAAAAARDAERFRAAYEAPGRQGDQARDRYYGSQYYGFGNRSQAGPPTAYRHPYYSRAATVATTEPNPAPATAASADVPQTNPSASEEIPVGALNSKALPDAGDAPPSTGDFIDALD